MLITQQSDWVFCDLCSSVLGTLSIDQQLKRYHEMLPHIATEDIFSCVSTASAIHPIIHAVGLLKRKLNAAMTKPSINRSFKDYLTDKTVQFAIMRKVQCKQFVLILNWLFALSDVVA